MKPLWLLVCFVPATANAQEWKASGYVEGDARAGLTKARAAPRGIVPLRETPRTDAYWERIQTSLALRVEGAPEPRLRVVADGRAVHRAEDGARRSTLGERTPDPPWRIDGDALFVEARGLGAAGAGWIRLGRQSVRWGRGLVAAPASVVSPPDLEDPLRFGSPRGSQMVRALVPLGSRVKLEAIAVHSFQPALLPPVAPRDALATSGVPAAEAIADDPSWTVELRLRDPLPPATFANAPLAARVTSDLPFLNAEVGASWYRGRSPIPEVAAADLDVDFAGRRLGGEVLLVYPRLQMVGADAALDVPLPLVDAVGVFGEAAWIEPRAFARTTSALGVEQRSTVLDEPYARGVAGVERAGDTYLALEWSRGFFDELGKSRQREYVFAIAERRFLRETVSVRVVAAHCLDDGSRLLAPEAAWSPRDAVTLTLAAYAGFGAADSKFAGPLAGDRVVLGRARASF